MRRKPLVTMLIVLTIGVAIGFLIGKSTGYTAHLAQGWRECEAKLDAKR